MIGPWQILIILVIVILLFGTKRLKDLGPDLGGAIKGFRTAVKEGEKEATAKNLAEKSENTMTQNVNEKETIDS